MPLAPGHLGQPAGGLLRRASVLTMAGVSVVAGVLTVSAAPAKPVTVTYDATTAGSRITFSCIPKAGKKSC